jgi:hypothetical protein
MDNKILIYFIFLFIILLILIKITNIKLFLSDNDKNDNDNNNNNNDNIHFKIAIASMIMKPVDLSLWLNHHRLIGVSLFFIRLEDTPELIDFLEKQQDVILDIGSSDINGNNYLTQNYRQDTLVNNSIKKCIELNYDWIFHIDSDELLDGNFLFLKKLSKKIKCLKLINAEAIYTENEKTCFSSSKFLKCINGSSCRSYSNGKAGGRVEYGVTSYGPHTFAYNGNYNNEFTYDVPFDDLHILHFDSCSFEKWVNKFKNYSINNTSNIPFIYYNESMQIVNNAFDVYKKHTMYDTSNINNDLLYIKN